MITDANVTRQLNELIQDTSTFRAWLKAKADTNTKAYAGTSKNASYCPVAIWLNETLELDASQRRIVVDKHHASRPGMPGFTYLCPALTIFIKLIDNVPAKAGRGQRTITALGAYGLLLEAEGQAKQDTAPCPTAIPKPNDSYPATN